MLRFLRGRPWDVKKDNHLVRDTIYSNVSRSISVPPSPRLLAKLKIKILQRAFFPFLSLPCIYNKIMIPNLSALRI